MCERQCVENFCKNDFDKYKSKKSLFEPKARRKIKKSAVKSNIRKQFLNNEICVNSKYKEVCSGLDSLLSQMKKNILTEEFCEWQKKSNPCKCDFDSPAFNRRNENSSFIFDSKYERFLPKTYNFNF